MVCILSLTVQVSAPLFASPTTRGGVKATVSTLSTDNNPSSPKTLAWLGNFWQTIRRDYGGGNVQVAYEYGYGFDGGRRWRKDYVSGVWTRYPCGVACGAGELVEQEKPLDGGQWATSALYLQGISLVRRNDEWHHFDPFGTAGVITNGTASVISRNLYDLFGVLRYEQGSAQTPWRWVWFEDVEETLMVVGGVLLYRPAGGYILSKPPLAALGVGLVGGALCLLACAWVGTGILEFWNDCQDECRGMDNPNRCMIKCLIDKTCEGVVDKVACLGCAGCLCLIPIVRPVCAQLVKKAKPILKAIKKIKPSL